MFNNVWTVKNEIKINDFTWKENTYYVLRKVNFFKQYWNAGGFRLQEPLKFLLFNLIPSNF